MKITQKIVLGEEKKHSVIYRMAVGEAAPITRAIYVDKAALPLHKFPTEATLILEYNE